MNSEPVRIFPLGDSAVTVEFGNVISAEINRRAIRLAQVFDGDPFPGFIETVPAYASTTLFYDPAKVRKDFPTFETAFDAVRDVIERRLALGDETAAVPERRVEIPVHFNADAGLDLEEIAAGRGLSGEELIDIFTGREYRVYMLGFLPGFSYMGEVDERIAVPRKQTPRKAVPKGSVGIAGRQTGIYSLSSPGGWQIIGRTDIAMFTPDADEPSYLRPGDIVRFLRA